MATPNAISKLISNPSPSSMEDIPEIIVQVLDIKKNGKENLRFTANDGKDKVRAIVFSDKSEEIENFGLIRILNYRVNDIPDTSSKFLLLYDFEASPSIGAEIKRNKIVCCFKLGDGSRSVSNSIAADMPNAMKLDDNILSEKRVALVYSEMLKHKSRSKQEPENPIRVSSIWERLESSGLTDRCSVLEAEMAEEEDLLRVHTQSHVDWVKSTSSMDAKSRLRAKKAFDSIYLTEYTREAAFLAAGCAIKAAERVASKSFDSAVAVIRPPGHHAEPDKAMGFCFLNNIAVAAAALLARPQLGIKKILIVDWDVHHGNGTQKAFYNDRRVLFFSIHRHGDGFYPKSDEGYFERVGGDKAAGYNINFPWVEEHRSDSDYLQVWHGLLLPVATRFNPDIVLISCGFDAGDGDLLGDCLVTPSGYSRLLSMLMKFAEGRVVLLLEGGYTPETNAASMEACLKVLLGDNPTEPSVLHNLDQNNEAAISMLGKVCRRLRYYWPFLVPEEEFDDSDLDKDTDPEPDHDHEDSDHDHED